MGLPFTHTTESCCTQDQVRSPLTDSLLAKETPFQASLPLLIVSVPRVSKPGCFYSYGQSQGPLDTLNLVLVHSLGINVYDLQTRPCRWAYNTYTVLSPAVEASLSALTARLLSLRTLLCSCFQQCLCCLKLLHNHAFFFYLPWQSP